MKPPPADLTTLAKRNEGKYPAGSVSAILTFGRSFVAHGAGDMPVWARGSGIWIRFKIRLASSTLTTSLPTSNQFK
jgi:hypothetical protein